MDKFNKFVENYEGTQYDKLPKFMKRRVDALKKLQLEHIKLQHQYNKKLQELEFEFEKLYQPLYAKRAQIVSGEYEPTDDECQLPPNLAENEFNGDQENSGEPEKLVLTESEEAELKSQVKGLPGFWLGCLSSTYNMSESIEERDRQVLKYLNDITLSYDQQEDSLSYKLEFHFDENPHFSDKVLTKTYFLKSNPDEKNPFSYEGFEVYKSEGCTINWLPGKDVTTKTVTKKQKSKIDGSIREKTKEVEQDSFFYFFKPPSAPEDCEEEVDEEFGAVMAVDFELGELMRQSLIPKAALYYTGFMIEEEDDDDDDEDDDDDGLDYDSEDLDESDADSHSSSDSLKKDK